MNADDFYELAAAFPEPLLLVTVDGEVVATNGSVARLLGRGSRELEGVALGDLAAEPERLQRFLRDCSSTRAMIPGRLELLRRDGTRVDCRAEGAVARPATSGGRALVILRVMERLGHDRFRLLNQKIDELSREIRVRMRLEHERDQLLESERAARLGAEEANRLKDEFLATLSHELRTPLNAIVGWASMLRMGVDAEQWEKGLEAIDRAARSQRQLIDDMLDVSRIITGKLRLDLRPINVSESVRAALHSVEPTAHLKGVRLEEMLESDPGPVSGDSDRIQQVAWNLLSNAINFTPRGGRVQVRVESVNSHVEIIVSDTGVGIGPDVLPFIFERFRQGEGSLTRSHKGLGIGLSIVRHLVEAHGGHVHAASDGADQGATFTVTLPLLVYQRQTALMELQRAHPRAAVDVQDIAPDRLSGLRVLIVEDEPESREMLTSLFASVGAAPRGVRTTAQALAEVESFVPDVIVSDIELIGEDGYMLARKLRAMPSSRGGRTPLVALTAMARSVDRVRALDAGFQMHLPKPVEPAELIAVVASLAERGAARQ